jgi:twitching motility protein PilT
MVETADVSLPSLKVATATIISAMLLTSELVSDLILSPGRPPLVKLDGRLVPVEVPGIDVITPADTARIAEEMVASNAFAAQKLNERGSCDVSYSMPKLARLRVNIFMQRGTCAIIMRVISTVMPTLESLNLPLHLAEIAELKSGLVLVTGPAGSGKSSTLAALVDLINSQKSYHIVTVEDPIEFSHNHKQSVIHQRELWSDTQRFDDALRDALRQSPDVILVGEMRDKETIEIVLEAAETGHLVLSTLHTIDASSTIDRIIGAFPISAQQAVRNRFSKIFRCIISQRLAPRKHAAGRIPVIEILKSTLRTREYIVKGESEGKTLTDAMRDGSTDGMQHYDGEIERLIRLGHIDIETGLALATNAGNLRLQLTDLAEDYPGLRVQSSEKDKRQASRGKASNIDFEIMRYAK